MIVSVVKLEKCILLAVPTATATQCAVIRSFCNNVCATVTNTHRRIVWLCGPRGCGKHFLFSACYKGVRDAGMLAAYVDCTKANGEPRSYYTLFQDLDQQLVDQIDAELPADLNPHGRTESGLQTIFSELVRLCSPEIVNIFVSVPDTNVTEAVRFVADIKSLAQEHNNIVVSALMGENSEAKNALEETQFANDPREEFLHLGLPSIQEYKNLAWTFADAFDRALSDETAALCAAKATKLHAPPSYINKLITEAAKHTADREITAEHIDIALQALDFSVLEPLKDPITAIPILQAYASLSLTNKKIKKIPDREPILIPLSSLHSTYVGLTQSLDIPTLAPTAFEEHIQTLADRGIVSLKEASSLSLNPRFCYTSYLNHILSWDYRHLCEQTPNTTTQPPCNRQTPLADTIATLYIGHLAALHAILSLHTTSPDIIISPQAYPAYVAACSEIDITPAGQATGFRKTLAALVEKRLIHTERVGHFTEIFPLISPHNYALVHNRFTTLKKLAQTPPLLLSDNEIAELLPNTRTRSMPHPHRHPPHHQDNPCSLG